MTSMQHWTPEQWAVFTVTLAAGLIAAAVVAVLRRYTAPALLRAGGPAPRPSIVMAERRTHTADVGRRMTQPLPTWVDPMAADFADPGIGALSSIQAITVDPTLRTSAEISAEESAWINAYADLSGLMPDTAAAAETMRINLEPALRKARLWRVRGERGSGDRALNDWRIDTATGEYRILTTADLAPYAAALLVS
jgi:hypothetical protein